MHKYAREIVSRYKNDTNVLQWEIGNEYFLAADLPVAPEANEARFVQGTGVKPLRGPRDSMTFELLRRFYIEMATYIKSIDSNHLVTSGDAGPRPESWELKVSYPQTRWRKDTLREYLADLLGSQPDPLDTISIHYYGSLAYSDPIYNITGMTSLEQLRSMARAIHAANTPVFIGEFGNTKPTLTADKQSLHPLAALDVIEQENVSLTCIWAWYFPWQPDNDMRADTHPALLKRVQAYNKKFAGL
jgi:endo-1,4-beta-mannosidase